MLFACLVQSPAVNLKNDNESKFNGVNLIEHYNKCTHKQIQNSTNRQCKHYIVRWRFSLTIVTMKMQKYFPSLLLMVHMQLSTTQKCSVLPWKCNNTFLLHCCRRSWSCQQYKSVQCCRGKRNNWFLLHCCRATKYFVLLTATISIKHYERVSAFLS
jgi:hypothetical protein